MDPVTTIRASLGRHRGVIKKSTISPSAVLIVISSQGFPACERGLRNKARLFHDRDQMGPEIISGLIFTQKSDIIIRVWLAHVAPGKRISLFLSFSQFSGQWLIPSWNIIIRNDHHHLNSRKSYAESPVCPQSNHKHIGVPRQAPRLCLWSHY